MLLGNIVIMLHYTDSHDSIKVKKACIEYSYENKMLLNVRTNISGFYGMDSPILDRHGQVVHVLTGDGTNRGCYPIVNAPKYRSWIALIQRGDCVFNKKIQHAVKANASAVIVYSDRTDNQHVMMQHDPFNHVVTLFILKDDGDVMANIIDAGITVNASIKISRIISNASAYTNEEGTEKKSNFLLILSLTLVGILFLIILIACMYVFNRSKFIRNSNRPQQVLTMEELMQAQQKLVPSGESSGC